MHQQSGACNSPCEEHPQKVFHNKPKLLLVAPDKKRTLQTPQILTLFVEHHHSHTLREGEVATEPQALQWFGRNLTLPFLSNKLLGPKAVRFLYPADFSVLSLNN